jgi:hypothetical protein
MMVWGNFCCCNSVNVARYYFSKSRICRDASKPFITGIEMSNLISASERAGEKENFKI